MSASGALRCGLTGVVVRLGEVRIVIAAWRASLGRERTTRSRSAEGTTASGTNGEGLASPIRWTICGTPDRGLQRPDVPIDDRVGSD
jgi:hypothetical protein